MELSMRLIDEARTDGRFSMAEADGVLKEMRDGAGSANLRQSLVQFMGPKWCERVLKIR